MSGGVDVDGAKDGEHGGSGKVAPHSFNAIDLLGRNVADHVHDSAQMLLEDGVRHFARSHVPPYDPLDGAVYRGEHADCVGFGIDDADAVRRRSEFG